MVCYCYCKLFVWRVIIALWVCCCAEKTVDSVTTPKTNNKLLLIINPV